MNAPQPSNETERLNWLQQSQILDTPPETLFDDITRMAASICDVPIAAISLVDAERQWFKSIVGLDVQQTPRDIAFCAHTILQSDVFVVQDTEADTRFTDNPLVMNDPHIRFYAGAPLITSDGYAIGALCVVDRAPRQLTQQQSAMLQVLASQIAGRIELQRHVVLQERLIAESRLVQEALVQREEELKAIVEHAMDGVLLFDPKSHRILRSNAVLRSMLDYTQSEMMTLTLYDIVGHVRSSIDRNVKAVLQNKELALGERQYLRKDKSVLIVEANARVITYEGQAVICLVIHDLTPQRESDNARLSAQASYQTLFENAAEGIFQTTPHGRYLRVNPALATMYGYQTPGQMIEEITDVSDQLYVEEGRRDEFIRLMSAHGGVTNFESQIKRRDGSLIWISESSRPVFNEHGLLMHYEGFVQDITERRVWEEQRERDLEEAQCRADRDPLTELWNHRAFQKKVEQRLCDAALDERSVALVMLDIDNFEFFNDLYGHVAGDEVIRMVAVQLQEVCDHRDILARFGGDEFALLLDNGAYNTREQIERDLAAKLSDLTFWPEGHGMAIPVTISIGAAVCPDEGTRRLDLLHMADLRLRRAKSGGGMETDADQMRASLHHSIDGFSMLDALVTAVDNKDRYTRRHSEDVMDHCLVIAGRLGISKSVQHTIAVAALLHDVGKIGVPDAILRKPGRLTDEEVAAIKQHPQMGAAIVSAVTGLEATLDAIRHHHESYDGNGYPFGLKGEGIPLIARIMAVADAYSAMTMDRPYRKGMQRERALSILADGAGKQWDTHCVEVFLEAHGVFTATQCYAELAA